MTPPATSSWLGAVNGWCRASRRPSSSLNSNMGKSVTHRRLWAVLSTSWQPCGDRRDGEGRATEGEEGENQRGGEALGRRQGGVWVMAHPEGVSRVLADAVEGAIHQAGRSCPKEQQIALRPAASHQPGSAGWECATQVTKGRSSGFGGV